METRTKSLLSIRPSLDHIKNTDDPASEAYFQNEVLRPILKFQNDLFVQVLKNYFLKHKTSFYSLSLEKRLLYIENALQKDIKFRNVLKGIIIGHKGSALKRVGVEARKDLEKFFGKQIHIELYVKVNKNWRSNVNQLKRFGYNN